MRPRFLICFSIFVLVVLGIMFWMRPKHGTITPTSTQEAILSTNSSTGGNVRAAQQGAFNPSQMSTSSVSKKAVAANPKSPEGVRQYIERQNVPIEFYGKFIDQDSNALAGVSIKISIRHWTVPDPNAELAGSKEIYLSQTSDANGRFEFRGATGDAVYIESVKKNGYELEPRGRNFGTTDGSFDNPVIFKMWNNNIHEKLITGHKTFQIVPDGRPYFINLSDDTISESGPGDLKVWIQYTNQIVRGQLYDWSAGIEVINGGLLEESLGSPMFEAPDSGYVPSFELQQQINGGQSGEIGQRKFYLRLKNGQEYGQLSIDLYAPWNHIPGLVSVQYAINPSGSRILR